MRAFVLAAVLLAPVGTPAHDRAGLVDLQRFSPTLELDLRYATKRNLTGGRLPGCKPWAMMLRPAARDLARVQRGLRRRGLGLKLLDASSRPCVPRARALGAQDRA